LLPLVTKYAPKPVSDHYAEVLKQTDEIFGKIEDLKKQKSTAAADRAFEASKFDTPPEAADGTRDIATQPKATGPEWVQIDRKWYKKSPNNIYYVNGKKILFIENRQRATPQSANAAAPKAE
ncbi:MAG: hypothetical protein AABZ31_13495, partial [Bdellovibrionota bacterium]